MYLTKVSGIVLIEVVVAIGIITVMLVAVGFSVTSYIDARSQLLTDLKMVYLAEEGYEIVRALRDDDWTTLEALTVDDIQYLDISTTTIAVGSGAEIIDGDYYRHFVLRSVYRDADDDVVDETTPGASIDYEVRWVDVSVGEVLGTRASTFTALIANIYAI